MRLTLRLTHKQAEFCQRYVETGDVNDAYRSVYNVTNLRPQTIDRKAAALMAVDKIVAWISVLQKSQEELRQDLKEKAENKAGGKPETKRGQNRHAVTMDMITKMHIEAFEIALIKENPSAATQATQNLARVHGLFSDKSADFGSSDQDRVNEIEVTQTIIAPIDMEPKNIAPVNMAPINSAPKKDGKA